LILIVFACAACLRMSCSRKNSVRLWSVRWRTWTTADHVCWASTFLHWSHW
jgi:hypothetical protein